MQMLEQNGPSWTARFCGCARWCCTTCPRSRLRPPRLYAAPGLDAKGIVAQGSRTLGRTSQDGDREAVAGVAKPANEMQFDLAGPDSSCRIAIEIGQAQSAGFSTGFTPRLRLLDDITDFIRSTASSGLKARDRIANIIFKGKMKR